MAIRHYATKVPDVATHAEDVIRVIESLSQQEYNQCVLQAQMICDMLPNMVSHYADILLNELGRFKWIVDRKKISENRYKHTFKELYVGLVTVRSKKTNRFNISGS